MSHVNEAERKKISRALESGTRATVSVSLTGESQDSVQNSVVTMLLSVPYRFRLATSSRKFDPHVRRALSRDARAEFRLDCTMDGLALPPAARIT
jgi:hypothetical protein